MSTPINLNKARKARRKADAKVAADQNAVAYGRPKSEKQADAAEADRIARVFEGNKRDPE